MVGSESQHTACISRLTLALARVGSIAACINVLRVTVEASSKMSRSSDVSADQRLFDALRRMEQHIGALSDEIAVLESEI